MQDALRFIEHCIDRYAEQAWRTAYVMLSNAADADDLLQQAFVVAWRKADQAPRDNPWPWLAAIIGNEARNFRRKRARRRSARLEDVGEPAMQNDPQDRLERAELAALVHVSLADLSEDQRLAIVLTHLSGLSQSQAADALGIPLNTLKARVRRGLESLRDALGSKAPSLEGTLKNLPVAPPVGGFIAAKAAWTASLAGEVAVIGTTTAATAGGAKALFATMAATFVLTAGIVFAVALPDDEPLQPVTAEALEVTPDPAPVPEPEAPAPKPEPEPPPSQTEPTTEPEPPPEPPPVPTPSRVPEPEPVREEPYYEPPPAPRSYDEDDSQKRLEEVFGKSFEQRVEEAVDKGCDWLKQQQGIDPVDPKAVFGKFPETPPPDGSSTPHRNLIARTAFPVQALCKAGCFVDEKEINTAMEWLRENYTEQGAVKGEPGFVNSTTYEDATLLLAVEAYYISAWETKEAGLSNPKKRFKKVEDENGHKQEVPIKRWGTEKQDNKRDKERNFKLDRKDQKMCEIAVKALETKFRRAYGGGGWRYNKAGMGEQDPEIDVSSTQYAILGLACASRLGIKYDKKILLEVYRFLRGQQDKDGPVVEANWKREPDNRKRHTTGSEKPAELKARGWGYCRQSNRNPRDKETYGSMTAAAVNALILIRDELIDDPAHRKTWEYMEEECNQMIGDGLGWMISNWSMQENPRAGHHRYYYYLYTVERLCMFGRLAEVGGHDWYYEGAEVLLKDQKDNGMWDIDNEIDPSDIYNTCYALLFLKRGTQGVDRPIPVISGETE